MAKKRGGSPLGNAPGAAMATADAAKANIDSLTRQLSSELAKTGESAAQFLKHHFGFDAVGEDVVWQLASGNTATFNEVILSYQQIRDDTGVSFDVNGRDQSLLTKESLEDLNSLEFQQFYPAVGREVNGKIDILDGSRRRAWFLFQQGKVKEFRILVTQDDISVSDAKALAKQLQTAKEHNQREIGLQCKLLMANGNYTQEQVAKLVGISRQAVGRALKAASIDNRLISQFPVVNALSHSDYSVLSKVMKIFTTDASGFNQFLQKIERELVNAQPEQSHEESKDLLMAAIKSELKIVESKKETEKVVVTPLADFETKGVFARKKVNGRHFSYEFSRLPKAVQDELDEAINLVINKFQQS